MLPLAVVIAMLGLIGAFGGQTRSAEALSGDICPGIYVAGPNGPLEAWDNFDGEGNSVYYVNQDTTYGVVFQVENVLGGWVADLSFFDPTFYIGAMLPGPNVHVEIDSETGSAKITSSAQAFDFSDRDDTELTGVDIEDLWLVPDITHVLITPGVLSQVVQTFNPLYFNDSNGFPLDSVQEWMDTHTGLDFGGGSPDDCASPSCSSSTYNQIVDGDNVDVYDVPYCDDWGYFDFQCNESGYFYIDLRVDDIQWALINDLLEPLIEEYLAENNILDQITPQEVLEEIFYWNLDAARTGFSQKFFCRGQADTATISPETGTVETQPTDVSPNGLGTKTITVTVKDQDGLRIDGVEVTFTTDNCTFSGDAHTQPAGGGSTVTTISDTDSTSDTNFLTNNTLEHSAGTAEAVLNCTTSAGKAGTANITAIVQRPGSDIVLKSTITVVGPTAVNGLTLTLTPDADFECGDTIKAVIEAVDANGKPVSDGTPIYVVTDTSSGVAGGPVNADGGFLSTGGKVEVLIATDPGNPGIHTVIAYVTNVAPTVSAQTSETYECDAAVAPAAPTVAPPATGTGTGSITPPNTGDAGLASGGTPATSLFVLAGAVVLFLAGLASVRFARN
jgi:hypothetical protein